jgi:hypothetical protein
MYMMYEEFVIQQKSLNHRCLITKESVILMASWVGSRTCTKWWADCISYSGVVQVVLLRGLLSCNGSETCANSRIKIKRILCNGVARFSGVNPFQYSAVLNNATARKDMTH